jgi:methionine-S-sulfoxide reductase
VVTGHLETVETQFDPTKITCQQVPNVLWRQIDPIDPDATFADHESRYRAAMFVREEVPRRIAEASSTTLQTTHGFDKPIARLSLPAGPFHKAEDYHPDYHAMHPAEYRGYRWRSARATYVERVWKDESPIEGVVRPS